MDWFFIVTPKIIRLVNKDTWRQFTWLASLAREFSTDTACKTPTNVYIFHHVISSMTYDVIKKRLGNFLSGWTLNGSKKTLLGTAFQRLHFQFLHPPPALSSPLFFRAPAPLYSPAKVEQILWWDQKIWSGKLAAQKLTRDDDLHLYNHNQLYYTLCDHIQKSIWPSHAFPFFRFLDMR